MHTALHNLRADWVLQDKNVESLVRDVNSHMRQRQEQERLKNIIARIDSYEPIVSTAAVVPLRGGGGLWCREVLQETKDEELAGLLATSSHLDLTCPMPGCAAGQRRHLLMEGDLKAQLKYTNFFSMTYFARRGI